MNREYNDNREYKNALDELHFSEEAKNRMVERLMERAEQPAPRRVRRFPRIAAVGVAAALVLSIGAGASGVLKSASEVFAGVFGPTADTEIIDQIGRPIGASDTSNGVTVTADAILFDGYNYLISYTLEKDDGSAFDCTKNPDTGLYDLGWKRSDSTIGRGVDGASGSSYFYDEDPSDNAIQYVETMSYNDAVQTGGTVKITLGDLCVLNSENGEPTTIAKGAWRLKFQLEAGNSAVELPAGQTIEVNGLSASVDKVVISPIGYHVVYTVNGEAKFDTVYNEDGEEIPYESGPACVISGSPTPRSCSSPRRTVLCSTSRTSAAAWTRMTARPSAPVKARLIPLSRWMTSLPSPSATFPSRSSKNTAARHSILPGGFAVEKLAFSASCEPFSS